MVTVVTDADDENMLEDMFFPGAVTNDSFETAGETDRLIPSRKGKKSKKSKKKEDAK